MLLFNEHTFLLRDKNRNLTAYTKTTQKQIFLQKNDQIFPLTLVHNNKNSTPSKSEKKLINHIDKPNR